MMVPDLGTAHWQRMLFYSVISTHHGKLPRRAAA